MTKCNERRHPGFKEGSITTLKVVMVLSKVYDDTLYLILMLMYSLINLNM